MTLKQALKEFRASDDYKNQSDIHWFVWLLENPNSPLSLTGAVDLYNHDIIHILLNRGMDIMDEAYVIGFTMGNDRNTNSCCKGLFKFCARWLYPDGYRFSEQHLLEFDRGYNYGNSRKTRDIHQEEFNIAEDLIQIRKKMGINIINTK